MAWYDVFDNTTEDWYASDDDGWGITDGAFNDNEYYEAEDLGYWNNSDPWADSYSDQLDADYAAGDTSWYDNLDSEKLGLGGQINNALNKYAGKGSFVGGLLGGNKGSLNGSDLVGYGRNAFDAYMGKRDNDRYNEMMQPMTDLYKDQAADVRNRRANRDTNLASEWEIASGMMQPGRDRMDQRAANLAQHQGVTQSSSNAWNKAANLQTRELTDLASRQQLADAYDKRTGALGGQLSGYNPMLDVEGKINTGYLDRQENPWLGMLSSSVTG